MTVIYPRKRRTWPTRRQGTSTTARSTTLLIVVTLIDAAGWMLPCLLLNASIIYCAWANRWI